VEILQLNITRLCLPRGRHEVDNFFQGIPTRFPPYTHNFTRIYLTVHLPRSLWPTLDSCIRFYCYRNISPPSLVKFQAISMEVTYGTLAFGFSTVLNIKSKVFCIATSCNSDKTRLLWGIYRLHYQDPTANLSPASAGLLLRLHFNPEDGGKMFLLNGTLSPKCTMLRLRRRHSSIWNVFTVLVCTFNVNNTVTLRRYNSVSEVETTVSI
jgi:hypothetical protein